ncbi:MAG: nuclear transport factor 2 family protein [Acidobacteriota bacterium]|nr:nuclear transport factor 2 family protein [Acidobacteriota bacterium]
MTKETDLIEVDRQFDEALVKADGQALDRLLASDFVLIDLMGNQIPKAELIAAIESRNLQMETLDPSEVAVRLYGDTAVVTGTTDMRARQGEASFAGRSRFTHVYIKHQEEWRMAAAQGTIIP